MVKAGKRKGEPGYTFMCLRGVGLAWHSSLEVYTVSLDVCFPQLS